jgi:GT2 family glycosyltransferase
MSRRLEPQAGRETGVTVSIIILNWNRSSLTRDCLLHIQKHTSGVPYEIIIVDNGSSPDEVDLLRTICREHNARLIELNQNLYFGEANNIAAEAAQGEILLLLNNDVTVGAGYIQPLIKVLNEAYLAGAVGPKFIYPNGKLQEAGGYIRPDGWTIQYGKTSAPADAITARGPHIVDYCSAACLLLRRDVFLRAGGFDPLFDPAYFEDVDLMLRIRSMGLFTYLCADVTVVHHENATSKEVWDQESLSSVIITNHRRFVERWGNYVRHRLFTEVEMPVFAPLSWTPAAAVTTDIPTIVMQGTGLVEQTAEWTSIIILASKLAVDHHVVFAAEEACSRCRIFTLADRAGVALGSFSITRTSNLALRSSDTFVNLSIDAQRGFRIVSGTGPYLNLIEGAVAGL